MNTSCVIKLDNSDYSIIVPGKLVLLEDASPEELQAEINNLNNESQVESVEEVTQTIPTIALIPTFDCTLRCIYCYSKGGESKKVLENEKVETVLKSEIFDFSKGEANFVFVGGGEPLMYIDKVSDLLATVRSFVKEPHFSVVTNGVFCAHTVQLLKKHKFNIRLSYDSIMQDVNRPFPDGSSSLSVVRNSIGECISEGLDPIVQTIITEEGVNLWEKMLDDILRLKVKLWKIEPMLPTDVSIGSAALTPGPLRFGEFLLNIIKFVSINKLPLKIDTGFFGYPDNGYYCDIAKPNFILTPDGLITSCVEVTRCSDPYSDKIIYGSVTSKVQIDQNKVDWLRSLHYNNERGGCPMANIWKSKLPYSKNMYTCKLEQFFLTRLLKEAIKDPSILEVITENTEITRNF